MITATPFLAAAAEIGPGEGAMFPRGWTGTSQIHETIRKPYVLF